MSTYRYVKKCNYLKNEVFFVVYNTKPYPIETVAANPNDREYILK